MLHKNLDGKYNIIMMLEIGIFFGLIMLLILMYSLKCIFFRKLIIILEFILLLGKIYLVLVLWHLEIIFQISITFFHLLGCFLFSMLSFELILIVNLKESVELILPNQKLIVKEEAFS